MGCVLGVSLPGLTGAATPKAEARSAYGGIPSRNVFGLRPPDTTPTVAPAPVLPSVRLTGITTLFAHKLVLLKVRWPAQRSGAAEETALSLEEGQNEQNIQVLAVDEKAGRVELLNCGTRMAITFEPSAAPPPVAPRVRPLLLRTFAPHRPEQS